MIRLKYIGVRTKDAGGILPLFLACQQTKPHVGVIRALLQAYPEAATRKIHGFLAMHHLVYRGVSSPTLADAVLVLLAANKCAASTPNNLGYLPLHYLCESTNPPKEAIRVLLQSYPMAVAYKNKSGRRPVDSIVTAWKRQQEIFSRRKSFCLASEESPCSVASELNSSKMVVPQNDNSNSFPNSLANDLESLIFSIPKDFDNCVRLSVTADSLASSEEELTRELVRLILCTCPVTLLASDQLKIVREMNWDARKLALLATLRSSSKQHFLASWYTAFPGVWRNVISYL